MSSKFVPIVLMVSFVSIAVFGFIAMDLEGNGHHGGCIATTASGGSVPCPESPFFSALFHLSAFKNFSLGTLAQSWLYLAFALLLVFAVYMDIASRKRERHAALAILNLQELFRRESFSSTRKFTQWLSLREKLDPAALSG